ncbi:MAG TPA: hypothetical protein VMX95_04640 [Thermodesulfobacteriota bacterium]|nr:hypothetical protein [Thermodesulfobacteriota bacterium]
MSLKTKNLIILGIIGAWIVIILIPILLPSERGGKLLHTALLPPLPPQKITAEKKGPAPSPAASPGEIQEERGKDLFTLPAGIRTVAEESEGESAAREVMVESKLTAIFRGGTTSMAAINHQIVREGDVINGEKVLKIGRDQVTLLARDGSRKALALYGNLPSVTVISPKEGGK